MEVDQGPAAASYAWRVHWAEGQPQSELECVAERTVAEVQCVVDGQRGEPDGRRPGSTAEHACLVLLCALQRAAPIVDVGNGTGGSESISKAAKPRKYHTILSCCM